VLDAGCGEGHNTRILAAAGAKMTGVDISPKMIRFAGAAEKRQPFGIQYKVASFSDLSPFRAASFDTVVSFMALMDGPEYPGAVREIYRVLKPGGNLFFNISHPCFMTKGMDWVRNEAGEPVKLAVSDYFSKEHYVERWSFGAAGENVEPFSIPYFGRTLSDYINPLADTGFVLRKLQEPRPSLRLCHEHPEFLKWRNTAAIFLHVHASKP
jgi:ubiquinone/menaquinone biosynthesis C-methylase UbiE